MITTASTTATTPVAESPRVPMMTKARLNFVIPKNKLSGSLVPVTSKGDPIDAQKEEPTQPTRKTKWGPDLTQDVGVKRGRALALQTRAEQLAAQLESGTLDIDNEETLSPPPPFSDTLGQSMNPREVRTREELDLERREAIGECMRLNSSYKPPSGYKPVAKEAKLYIPVKEHPGYNFIGLILGPRGNTQRWMEAETGAKISIKGKGAVKEGKMQLGRQGKEMDGTSEELHVHISADTFEKVDAAVAIIEPLLTPVDEDQNVQRMNEFRELADMNGTIKDFIRMCMVCGEGGHSEWECPKEKLQTFQAKVSCWLCGDGGHPTIDCPLKNTEQGKLFDKKFLFFLEELCAGLKSTARLAKTDHPSGTDTSQPMLLTALGAQPMPSTWTALDSTGGPAVNGAMDPPKFTFPGIPLGFRDMNVLDLLLAHFVKAGLMPSAVLRGQPFPGSHFPMVAKVLSTLRRRFLFSPSVVWPSEPLITSAPFSSTETQVQLRSASGYDKPELCMGSQAVSNSQDEKAKQGTLNVASGGASMVVAPFLYSSTAPPFSGSVLPVPPIPPFVVGPVRNLPPSATSAPPFLLIPRSNSVRLEVPRPTLPLAPAPASVASPLTLAVRPILPSIRPALPSVRPVGPSVQRSPTFINVGAGQGPMTQQAPIRPVGGPIAQQAHIPMDASTSIRLYGGISSNTPAPNFHQPSQPVAGTSTIWGQGPFFRPPTSPQPIVSSLNNPSFAPSLQSFRPNNIPQLPTPPMVPAPSPMPAPLQMQAISQTLSRSVSPGFTPILPQPPQGHSVITPNNQLSAQTSTFLNSRAALPPLLGPQIRSVNAANMPSLSGNPSLPSPSQRPTVPHQQNFGFQPQGAVGNPGLVNAQVSHQGVAFQRAEFSHVRPLHLAPGGASVRADIRNPGLHRPGILVPPPSILGDPGFRRPPMAFSPQEPLNTDRNLSLNASISVHAPTAQVPVFPRSPLVVNETWGGRLPFRSRPEVQQVLGPQIIRPLLNAPRPPTQEVDPEYEKLMASVGVL